MATFASLSAFPAAGSPDNLYVAEDTNDSYRWDGTKYVRISERVLSTGVTDSTAVGRSVVTAVDQKAAKAAIFADFQVDPRDFGGVGDGVADDTAALLAALAALPKGGTLVIPRGVWTYSQDLVLPRGSVLRGVGRSQGSGTWETAPQLRPISANARIFVDDFCHVENLLVNGKGVGRWAFQSGNLDTTGSNWVANKVSFTNVYVLNFTEAAFVCEALQNSVFVNCTVLETPIGWWFNHGAANIEMFGCNWRITQSAPAVTARVILVKQDLVDTRFMEAKKKAADPSGWVQWSDTGMGARAIRVWGGIFETGASQYFVDLIDGFTIFHEVTFNGTEIAAKADTVAHFHLGPEYKGQLVLSDIVVSGAVDVVHAESGRVVYRNAANQAMGKNLQAVTRLEGTASVHYDEVSRLLIDSDFHTSLSAGYMGATDWIAVGTSGAAAWNPATRRMSMTCPSSSSGVGAKWRLASGGYATATGAVTVRFRIVDATAPLLFKAWTSGATRVLATVGNGSYTMTVPLQGDEVGFQFTGGVSGTSGVTAELDYFYCEHGGEHGGAAPPSTMPWTGILRDAWGNPWLEVSRAADAGNYIQIGNRASPNPPRILAAGTTDADVSLDLVSKGVGTVRANNVQVEVKGHTHTVAQVTGAAQWITTPPASATAPGTAGQLCHSGGFLYICVATNTWVWSKTTNTWPPA
jgi:hypothetical protein